MNKKLVLYHTYTGNTELVAKEIAAKTAQPFASWSR